MYGRYGENKDDPDRKNEGNGMYVKFEEVGSEKSVARYVAETRWSPRRTLLFIIFASLLGWSVILFLLYLAFA